MTRVIGWEAALIKAIEHHSELPFSFGTSDCAILPADCVFAVTGLDLFRSFRGYKTKLGGTKKVLKAGHADLSELVSAIFPHVPPSLAQRGDIGFVHRDGVLAGGVFTSSGFVSKFEHAHGVIYEPATAVSLAFKVD